MDFVVLPRYSLQPNKLSLFDQIFYASNYDKDKKYSDIEAIPQARPITLTHNKKAPVRKFHNFKISDNAYRTLKSKIGWLYHFAKARHVKTYNGKDIYNFKMAFITLTLPSAQIEPTIDITRKYFNHFITEIRQRFGMRNFVWRLEFQKNGNVHYHLVTDSYIDYYALRDIWNRILSKGGYVQKYTDKHKNLSLSKYIKMYPLKNSSNFNETAKRYARSCANNWLKPNSVDVKSVTSGKKIAFYISKYFAKAPGPQSICNKLDNETNSKALRLWFCSRSLSKLKSISGYCEEGDPSIWSIIPELNEIRKYVAQYATLFYFELTNFTAKIRAYYEKIFFRYGYECGYLPAL